MATHTNYVQNTLLIQFDSLLGLEAGTNHQKPLKCCSDDNKYIILQIFKM